MQVITTTDALASLCRRLADAPFVAVDTEFMRERTFRAQLCLVQIASPDEEAVIDPLAEGIDLTPLDELMVTSPVPKVFHSARQDIEIFFCRTGRTPLPLFDTQLAAAVCGFGDSVGYESLAARLVGAKIDKSSRFSDWAQRPLAPRQLTYALADVTHLREIYRKLKVRLEGTGREHWLNEEIAILSDPATYRIEPTAAWQRLRARSSNPRFLATVRELAGWRETEAEARDLPRSRLLKDETLLEVAGMAPTTVEALARARGVGRGFAEGRHGAEVLKAVARAASLPIADCPRVVTEDAVPGIGPVVELLRVLLKARCEEYEVAARLVASSADLEAIAARDDAAVPALNGWRREVFGNAALALKRGELALAVSGKRLRVVPMVTGGLSIRESE